MPDPYIEFKEVSKAFGDKVVLDRVSFDVLPAETVCILGRSGVGKSVSLHHIMGFLKPDSGRVIVAHEDNHTVIRVTDEGAGLSPEDLGRLFGRFQRLSAKPTAGESSTGLGLSIVKRIIDMHGGEVTANSDGPGKGSTFTITLPATEMS